MTTSQILSQQLTARRQEIQAAIEHAHKQQILWREVAKVLSDEMPVSSSSAVAMEMAMFYFKQSFALNEALEALS